MKLRITVCLFFLFNSVNANERHWYTNTTLDITQGAFEKHEQFDTGTNVSFILGLSYLEQFGFTLKATQAIYKLHNIPSDTIQNKFALLTHNHSSVDSLAGSINSSIAFFSVTGNSTTVNAFATSPEIYYLNNNQTFLLGGGYAYSTYGDRGNNRFNVNQYTANFGFVPFVKSWWLSSKMYNIENQNQTDEAYSIKLNWRVKNKGRLLPKSYLIGALMGSRRYAVEQDTLLIYNTEDEQTGGYFLSANWNISDNGHLEFVIGNERYKRNSNSESYNYKFVNASVTKTW